MRVPLFRNNLFSPTFSILISTQHSMSSTSPALIPPLISYPSLLQQCAAEKSLEATRHVHLHMKHSNFPHLSLGNKLIHAYLKCGSLDHARQVFDEMPNPHIVSWNSMITSYIKCRRTQEAISLFLRMPIEGLLPDEFTFSSILRAFSHLSLVPEGRGAHGRMVVAGMETNNVFTGSALVDMYAKFGRLGDARIVYDGVDDKDVVLATALIVGYTQNSEDAEAIKVFSDMVNTGIRPNEFTFASVLSACAHVGDLRGGMLIHGIISKSGFESRVASQTSLLSMYFKCGLIEESMRVFNQIDNPNTVTWTAMIGCLVCNQREEIALSMLCSMIREHVNLNEFTLSTALRGCSSLALFELGKLIHAHAVKIGLDRDRFVGAALIDMYGKCAHIGMARSVFDSLAALDLVSMNTMIFGCAQNGYGEEAVRLFDLMQNSGLKPNDATFIGVLSACSNAGMLEEGRRVFSSMIDDYKLLPTNEHYACMVDLLGRAGRLKEAEGLITPTSNPDKVLWRTLLSACRVHGDIEMAKIAARGVLEIDPGDDGTYVLLSNVYASSCQWNEVSNMKSKMRHMKLKKVPAMSWVEVNKEMHTFMAGDWSHPKASEIYKELEGLIQRTKASGYVPDTRFVLQDLDELEKEKSLYYHSEKLAVAFGVLSDKYKNNYIMIFKNLRVCGDCHTWIKLVSKIVNKEIIARDAKRFHHFKDGLCSCRDYW